MILNRPNLYLAGPLFSSQEKAWNRLLRDRLSDVCDVYLPQEDGALLMNLISEGVSVQEAKSIIFSRDLAAIDRCNVLLLVMDGRVIDEGASFELGYAYSRGKLCIGLKTDVRQLLTVGDNPMIECALREIFGNIEDVLDWINSGKWGLS
jgi:nucleoside 2-deoxyribosyltransferase